MEKKEQLLVCDPPTELRFRGPFTKPVLTTLRLTNPTDRLILFKIKTTAPRKYCVRPNFGVVEPHNATQVDICLQAIAFDPNEKNKHKFMVQSMVVPENLNSEDKIDYDKLWKEVQSDDLMDTKLRCVFELPEKSPAGDTNVTNEASVPKSSTPKAAGDEKTKEEFLNDYVRATAEVRQLQEEQSLLRQENLRLKEQVLMLKIAAEANQKEQSSSSSSQYQNPYSPPQIGQQQIPVMYIALAIVMGLFGLLLGKYLL